VLAIDLDLWKELAKERLGKFIGSDSGDTATIIAELRGVRVILEASTQLVREFDLLVEKQITRCHATTKHIRMPKFSAYPERGTDTIKKWFGAQDIRIGHALFDEEYIVKSKDPPALRRLLTPRTISQIVGVLPGWRLHGTGATITLEGRNVSNSKPQLIHAMEMVVHLASLDVYGFSALKDVSGPGYFDGDGGYPRGDLVTPARIRVATENVNGVLVSAARLYDEEKLPKLAATLFEDRPPTEETVAALPASARAQLANVGTGELKVGGKSASFIWPEVQTRASRLRAGVASGLEWRFLGRLAVVVAIASRARSLH
jgi:hypothetical protein